VLDILEIAAITGGEDGQTITIGSKWPGNTLVRIPCSTLQGINLRNRSCMDINCCANCQTHR
jgi:hypothetical protein